MAKKEPTAQESLAHHAARRLALAVESEETRLALAEAIRTAAAEGIRQVDIVKTTGYTREQVRLIVAGRTR